MKLTGFESNKINSDMVNHPSHYNLPDRKECIDEMIDIYGLKDVAKWCEITAYKYKYRAGHKDSLTQDVLQKAIWYTVKGRELKSKRRWEKFSKIADRYLPMFIKGIFTWIMLFCMLHAILFSDPCSMVVSIVFLALACVTESILKENEV
nr:MAG TPA: nucelotide kinase [Caudoviricetes sp.]